MSDYVPFVIQAEIMKRLPTKSLMRFRSVSKTWKSLIDSPKFIADYSFQQTHQHHILVSYFVTETGILNYVSILDDDSEPFPLFPLTPNPVPGGRKSRIIVGSSQGLFCLYNTYYEKGGIGGIIHLWNPSIRKSVAVDVPYVLAQEHRDYRAVFGLWVCTRTSDVKLVKVSFIQLPKMEGNNIRTYTPWQVELYTLSVRAWRSIPTVNQPRNSISLRSKQVFINEFIYWLALDGVGHDNWANPGCNMIVAFDMTSLRFMEISLPTDTLTRAHIWDVAICKVRESLVVVDHVKDVYDVWMMVENGVPSSFTKIFTVNIADPKIELILGFRKNEEPIFLTRTHYKYDSVHDIYVDELCSEQKSYIVVSGPQMFYSSFSYMETLLLLDQ